MHVDIRTEAVSLDEKERALIEQYANDTFARVNFWIKRIELDIATDESGENPLLVCTVLIKSRDGESVATKHRQKSLPGAAIIALKRAHNRFMHAKKRKQLLRTPLHYKNSASD